MSESVTATLPLRRWQGDRGTYHLVGFTGEEAETLTGHALMHRLEFGKRGGFGSVKVMARIGETTWKTSVFPQKNSTPSSSEAVGQTRTPSSSEAVGQTRTPSSSEAVGQTRAPSSSEAVGHQKTWILLVSKKVMKREDIAPGDNIAVSVTPI